VARPGGERQPASIVGYSRCEIVFQLLVVLLEVGEQGLLDPVDAFDGPDAIAIPRKHDTNPLQLLCDVHVRLVVGDAMRRRHDSFHVRRFDQIVFQRHFDESPNLLLDIAVADRSLAGMAVVAIVYPVTLIALGLDSLDQLQHMLVVPPHFLDGLFPDWWHTLTPFCEIMRCSVGARICARLTSWKLASVA